MTSLDRQKNAKTNKQRVSRLIYTICLITGPMHFQGLFSEAAARETDADSPHILTIATYN